MFTIHNYNWGSTWDITNTTQVWGKENSLLAMVKTSGYNLTPTTDTASKPTAQVPPKGPSSITQQCFPSLDNPIRIGTHLMVI
jgi:hypothetical protein